MSISPSPTTIFSQTASAIFRRSSKGSFGQRSYKVEASAMMSSTDRRFTLSKSTPACNFGNSVKSWFNRSSAGL
ncbi:MAG TPA: hypothetical protein VGI63_08355 [Verrucomicrobiae bacterium]